MRGKNLAQVKAMTFDVFGTVVDWRSSIAREIQNNQEESHQQTDIVQSVNQEEKEETALQLFNEEEDADASKKEDDLQKGSESLR